MSVGSRTAWPTGKPKIAHRAPKPIGQREALRYRIDQLAQRLTALRKRLSRAEKPETLHRITEDMKGASRLRETLISDLQSLT